jgi:hypothetical protein
MEHFFVEQFHAHFIRLIVITVSMGIVVLSLFTLAIMRSNDRRLRQYPKPTSASKFGPDVTQPVSWHDEIAKHDRDLEKWREEHKGQIES